MPADFADWFASAHDRGQTGDDGRPLRAVPHPWQRALAAEDQPLNRLIRIPTGFGKTLGVLSAWLYHRVERGDARWPARLVWMLPMRTLVEQTEIEVSAVLSRLGLLWDGQGEHAGRVGVHVLMGGAEVADWHLHPGQPAVLIGTQDMLLSRALNRGYGAARARWPIDFGLLSQDALWVLDEVQLMGVGFATALQIAAFRQDAPALRPAYTWAMSATLQREWLEKSPDTVALRASFEAVALSEADEALPIWANSAKPRTLTGLLTVSAQAQLILQEHAGLSGDTPLSLVVVNTVQRARELSGELERRANGPTVTLIHSRFRGHEREAWSKLLRRDAEGTDRIIVATQVVEAGVDISADLLFTDLCPWPSLVQRVGRLARRGGEGRAIVFEVDLKKPEPYDVDALTAALDALQLIEDLSSKSLAAFESEHPKLLPGLYPFEPPHLLLSEELHELFDTTADLSGGDLDISRFIREGDERDLSVAWVTLERDARGRDGKARARPPSPRNRPGRDALCAVPFLDARDWLCGKKSGGVEPRKLREGVAAYVWDYQEGAWRLAERHDLRPGVVVLVDASAGGYDPQRGLDPGGRAPVPVVPLIEVKPQDLADNTADRDDLSQISAWQTIGYHGGAVARELQADLRRLALGAGAALAPLLDLAGRWHDLGKAHPAFQGAIGGVDRPQREDLAKAPKSAWSGERCIYRLRDPDTGTIELRPGFRHELASALALFDVLSRWAPAEHPARLGALAGHFPADPPRAAESPGAEGAPSEIEREVLALSAVDFDLVAFLVCAHHGKLRARLHAGPADQAAALHQGDLPIRGVYEGDALPSVSLPDASGHLHVLPQSLLSLEPAALGLSTRTGRSWTERVDGLRARWGPFALAWLESLVRAADVRASKDVALRDSLCNTPLHANKSEVVS